MTSPGKFSCPQDCHYCPNDPESTRSYDRDGPVARRAAALEFDVVRQFRERAVALATMGHEITKVEVLVIGGTWSYHPIEYQQAFMTGIYYAANTFQSGQHTRVDGVRPMLSLAEEREINETAVCRIIGLTIETRPDHISFAELERLLQYGVTRVQLGIQHLNDRILETVNRKCRTAITVKAIRLLKQNCFKIDGHFMPDLPGSSYSQDREMFEYLFSPENEDFQVDQMKVYPTMITRFTKILEWYRSGQYRPYAEEDNGQKLFDLIVYITTNVPRWIRLNRVVRDIPSTVIEGEFKETNLYQRILKHLEVTGLEGQDIRWREIKLEDLDTSMGTLYRAEYRSSEGTEHFISWETTDGKRLFGFREWSRIHSS